MAYDWRRDTNTPETVKRYYGRVGWLTRLIQMLERNLRFLGRSGDYHRKA